jgi:hypothetical protein
LNSTNNEGEGQMADKNGQKVEGKVVNVETRHFLKLIADKQRTVNLPIGDRDNVPAIDPMYRQYQVFTRVLVTIDYNGNQEVLKSRPIDVGEVVDVDHTPAKA